MESVDSFVAHSSSDLSIWGLFLAADPLVKSVMLLLVLASIWCWAIIFEKVTSVRKERRHSDQFEDAFWSGGSADALYDEIGGDPRDAMTRVFVAGMREWRRAKASGLATAARSDLRASLLGRVERSMTFTITREMERLEKGMNFLASIGSVSPFVGLFGTVWGIMNSFRGLAAVKQATLATVAPGISEALVATAIGLFAAIPAVIAYNRFTAKVDSLAMTYENFADEFAAILHRRVHQRGE